MTYALQTSSKAEAYLRRLDPDTQRRIVARLQQIAIDPYGGHSKVLADAGGRRAARVGAFRIIFRVDDADRIVTVSAIGPRGQVYRNL